MGLVGEIEGQISLSAYGDSAIEYYKWPWWYAGHQNSKWQKERQEG